MWNTKKQSKTITTKKSLKEDKVAFLLAVSIISVKLEYYQIGTGFPIVFQRGGGDKISQKVHRFWQKVSSHDFHHGLGRKCKKYGNLPKFNRKEVFLFDFLPEKRQKKLKNRISVSF